MYWGRPYTPAMPDEFEGQRVTVMGLGRFGGGVGVARFLAARGADVLVTDQSSADKLADSVAQLQPLIDAGQVTLRLGEHNVSDFTTCDRVVVNPAVPPGNRFIRAAKAAGIPVTTEVRLLVERLPNRLRTIGVTGSAGKSTVTAMIGHVLGKVFADGGLRISDCGLDDAADPGSHCSSSHPEPEIRDAKSPRVWVGGNIGGSLLERIDEIGPEDWVVLELSSFMLERLRADEATGFPGWSPHIAVITNISENHLDWHGSMEAYVAAKQVILDYQNSSCVAVLGPEAGFKASVQPLCAAMKIDTESGNGFLSLPVPGSHNRINAMCALAASDAAGVMWESMDLMAGALADFPGLPHRLEFVGEYEGVKFYNDSKCTTPGAAMLAIGCLCDQIKQDYEPFREEIDPLDVMKRFTEELEHHAAGRPGTAYPPPKRYPLLHVILGGYDKQSDLAELASSVAYKNAVVYTIGATGELIARLVGSARWGEAEVVRCGTLERAVEEMRCRVGSGDVVLLSPGCASWDQFDNYERRGERFIELVRRFFSESGRS